MKESVIIERVKEKKLRNGILITGLPGIGLIGQVVGRYMVEEVKAKRIARLLSPHFPHQVFMTKNGGMRLIRNSFFIYRGKKRDVLFLVGDIQAMSSVGQYEVAGVVMNYAKKMGVKEILTVGGYSTGKISEERRIFAVTTSEELKTRFKKLGVIFGEARGSIVGAAGLFPAIGQINGINGSCIMGETHGGYVDTASARQIVLLLSKYADIPINIKRLDQKAAESQKVLKKVQEDIKRSMENQFETTTSAVSSYIR